jgi:hypothetical protein
MTSLTKLLSFQYSKEDVGNFADTAGADLRKCRVRDALLPNGRRFELTSRKGADDCVDAVGTDFISTNLIATNYTELTCAYVMIITVLERASPRR